MAQHRASSKRAPRGPNGPGKSEQRLFTLAHATRALTYVKRVVEDVVAAHAAAMLEQGLLQASAPGGTERSGHQKAFAQQLARLNHLVEELRAVGVDIRDQAAGVIEFPSMHKRQPAVLVWKMGEEQIMSARLTGAGPAFPIEQLDERE